MHLGEADDGPGLAWYRSYNSKRFVHISTAAVHGFRSFRNADQTLPLANPPFPYCETKKMAEQWLFGFARSTHMEVTAIRPGNVFGPRDHTFIEKYLDALIAGKIAYIVGGDTGSALCTSKIW